MQKRILSIAIAIIAIVVMAMPAAAQVSVGTGVTINTNTTAPFMILTTVTPDDTTGDGVQVSPEFAIPLANGKFSPIASLNAASDGWKRVQFYVEVGHVNGIANINNVAIDVNYPGSFNSEDAPLFDSRKNALKFEINVNRAAVGGWVAQLPVYPWTEYYPQTSPAGSPTAAVMPALAVRELVYGQTSDWVDTNANGTQDAGEPTWQNFIPLWGDARIQYSPTYGPYMAFDRYQLGQALVLEITGWFWFHQPGVAYTVSAKAATESGATSEPLTAATAKFLNYNRVIGLYTDFTNVTYLNVAVGQDSWADGDRWLETPGITTVWNNGNVSAKVGVQSTKMVKDFTGTAAEIKSNIYYNSPAKTIQTFDAKLYYTNGTGTVLQLGSINYTADEASPKYIVVNSPLATGEVGPVGAVLLQACRPAKIEFSVHPELGEGQEAGNYKGFLTVSVATYTGTQMPTP